MLGVRVGGGPKEGKKVECSQSVLPMEKRRPPGLTLPDRGEFAVLVRSAREGRDCAELSEGADGVWWVVSRQGRSRSFNEDAVGIVDGKGVFAVFDGHGGRKASQFASEHLIRHFEALSHGEVDMQEALKQAFVKTDEEFYNGSGSAREKYVGTTAIAAVLRNGKLVVGHVGDSRAVLASNGKAVELSRDHVTSRADELNRVRANGGYILGDRVNGVLKVTRAIGDHPAKSFIIAEPEVLEMEIADCFQYLIIASDGLWQHFTNEQAVEFACKYGNDVKTAAQMLVEEAQTRGSCDDISVLVLSLENFKKKSEE
ncbi:hypothetical protein NDN08_003759 [Rhodosorus marinus]|uniref:PPM-type phosphatase domain-containing protein n=1 Tax=Rhodosorus marinus TaxID=101924 RepID=A0AAV8UGD5_9RHOD|nr:hypothetical protein NDN08_003759 [Rhodosorus marinus]